MVPQEPQENPETTKRAPQDNGRKTRPSVTTPQKAACTERHQRPADVFEGPPEETLLRRWQLPLNATEAQIRKASFLVRRDLAKRQHEAAVKEKRRALGSHGVKF